MNKWGLIPGKLGTTQEESPHNSTLGGVPPTSILVLGLAYVWAKGDLDWVKGLVRRDGTEVSGE